jgi:hypothetical protein
MNDGRLGVLVTAASSGVQSGNVIYCFLHTQHSDLSRSWRKGEEEME